jgi:hypothetical protein
VLPSTYVVGPDGALRYSVIGELDWADDAATAGVLRLVPAK